MPTYDPDEYEKPSYSDKCNRCGTAGLEWRKINGKWRLVDSNDRVHICNQP